MKKIFTTFLLTAIFFSSYGVHTKGGWLYYEYLGPGISDPTALRYKIGLKYYIDCNSSTIETAFSFSIFNNVSPFTYVRDVVAPLGPIQSIGNCAQANCYPCISNPPFNCYKVIDYETTVELPATPNGYVIAKQRCCRIGGLANITVPSNAVGETYTVNIPGVNQLVQGSQVNSSPKFAFNDTAIVCALSPFKITFNATDPDNDSLVYSFCNAFTGGDNNLNTNPEPTSNPPFSSVPYLAPFSGTQPLGSTVSINPITGEVSGIAPAAGEYVITICVAEYRNGVHFADARKELHLKVQPCNPVVATLDPDFLTCGDLNLSFFNQTDNPNIQNWYWIFGDPASGANDTAITQVASHTFSAPGVYTVKLIVNRGLPCIDSASQTVRVFPGFFPGFQSVAPLCVGQPVQFLDSTKTNHGTVSFWSWNFGDNSTLADTSHVKNPSYVFNNTGTYTVKLTSGNSLGCKDTVSHVITINPKPILSVSGDTTYCGLDSVQLSATGSGNLAWSPNTRIIGAGTASPVVFPTAATTYYAVLESQGCTTRDSVRVNPVFDLSNAIAATPQAICQEDTVLLTGSTNKSTGVSWKWTPSGSLASPATQTTKAYPLTTTTYSLQTTWGKHCVATATTTIAVTPLAVANAGPDQQLCTGQGAVQLNASGGNSYSWSPAAGLSSTSVANPLASPTVTTTYIVQVGVNGCSKTKPDTVIVMVRPKPVSGISRDTLICIIDTLQLHAAAGGTYQWTPNYMISNTSISSPLVSPDVPTVYHLLYTDAFGCKVTDSVLINVKPKVTLNAGPDTTICKGDAFILNASGDAVTYTWLPGQYLNNTKILRPSTKPDTSITYTLIGDIGKCQAQDQVTVKVVAPPKAFAGPDTTICIGESYQLSASGGSMYTWSPTLFLSAPGIANPVVQNPTITRQYVVTVSDTLGCPKISRDTILVQVIPPLRVDAGPRDTNIVLGQTVQLQATGASAYLWTPATSLNSTIIANPVSSTRSEITYVLTGTDTHGCTGADSITVHVFRIDPDMYVPTAFTPNGDGLNDVARPIMIGMKSLTYFRIYNRFGNLVFSTNEIGKGWDGIYKGKPQDMANFVWVAEGVTFTNEVKRKKGNLVLIRN